MVFLEGSAPALPKKSVTLNSSVLGLSPIKFRSCKSTTLQSKTSPTPNEFGALKIRHQPLAEAIDMAVLEHPCPLDISRNLPQYVHSKNTAL